MERIKLAIERAREQAAAHNAPRPRPSTAVGLRPRVAPVEADENILAEVVPLERAHLERHRIVALDQGNPLRRPFDLLRTQVLQKMQEHGWRTVAITSPSAQSGKTVVAVNLAMSIAHHPSRTALLVDFDLRRPSVASSLGLHGGDSLNEVLAGKVAPGDAIVHAGMQKFLVLPTQRPVAGAADVLASERVGNILGGLRDGYPERIIVLDLPPVTAVDDVIAVLPRVDCVLLVVGSGSSTRRELEEAQRHLARFNLLGVVVNKVAEEPMQNYY